MSYLLDTTTCAFYLRGRFQIRERIREVGRDTVFISEITVAELLYGAHASPRLAHHLELANRFIRGVRTLHVGPILDRYAREKARLRRAGTPVGDFDILTGVTAVAHGLAMVSDNERDLGRIDGIELVNWVQR